VLVEYNKAPAVTRERLYLETMQQIMTSTSKILIDARSGGNLLMLPLDKLLQMPATGAGDGLAGARPAESAVTPEASGRARDSLRSRDREGRP
jgi:membrane protease subunit HflK